jgi:GNAT superfamily N-acetyltransferase
MELLPVAGLDPVEVLDAINDSFDQPARTLDWYRWKHLEGPWGPSAGWAAVVDGRVLGVRLFVPWRVRRDTGHASILRAMDGAVRPEARRNGLFSRLILLELDRLSADPGDVTAVYSTSVPASREAYRKLGWAIFDVDHHVQIAKLGRARLEQLSLAELPPMPTTQVGERLRTDWTARSMQWRTDPRSGYEYSSVRLRSASSDNGLIVRQVGAGPRRALVICHAWGDDQELAELVSAAARVYRTPFIRSIKAMPGCMFHRCRGASTVSLWAPTASGQADLGRPEAWDFSYADLEGTM